MTFDALQLSAPLMQGVADAGFLEPTPIQRETIPLILAGRDVLAQAETGSGKTAAFVLPVLQRLFEAAGDKHEGVRVLTLAPTRELALQVATTFRTLGCHLAPSAGVVAIIGGAAMEAQIDALTESTAVVVATPGRLVDLIGRYLIDLSEVHTLILDEADKMLDTGFQEELDVILRALPSRTQSLLFSATLPEKVQVIGARVLRDPVAVRVDPSDRPVASIEQRVYQVDRPRRRMLLQHFLQTEEWGQTLVFAATQRACANLTVKLRSAGVQAVALHGGLTQVEREDALAQFKSKKVSVLVATDLAARGIDVPQLGAVVNFDLPRSPRDYLHRIGRTGRAGESGMAISFVDHESEAHFRVIEKKNKLRLPREQIAGFELTGDAPAKVKGPSPKKGKRRSKKDKLREGR